MAQIQGVRCSLEAQTHIWSHLFNFVNSMALKCAVELRISEAIHKHGGQPVTLSQLALELGIRHNKAAFLHRLMRVLTHSGFFTVQDINDIGEEGYLLTNSSMHLLRDSPHTLAPLVLGILDPWLVTPWQSWGAWFLHPDSPTPFHLSYGGSLWEVASQTPELNDTLNEAMASDSQLIIDAVVKDHGEVFRELKSLVDVGGGNGATAMALAKAFPQLKCTVLELPHVVASATAIPKSGNVVFMAGDMFEYIPPADAVFLKWVMHDWSDDQCVKLLKRCKGAVPPKAEGGKVIIVDMVMSDDLPRELREAQYAFDMLTMVLTHGGKQRSEREWQKLFHDAGFRGYEITPGLGSRAIIEVYH